MRKRLRAVLLWGLVCPALAQALPISTGPYPEAVTAPVAQKRMGPDGAQIKIVKHADTFNLTGNNVKIGQIESQQPLATHNALNGHVTVRDPAGANGNHPTGVADILIGRPFTPMGQPQITGVASGAKLWSTGGVGGAFDATEAQNIKWVADQGVQVINFSGGNRVRGDGTNAQALYLDHIVRANDILWAQAIDNTGPGANTVQRPEDAYNAITVGATGAIPGRELVANGYPSDLPAGTGIRSDDDYTRVAPYSGRGTTVDGRHKPDIVAPGSEILMAGNGSNNALYLGNIPAPNTPPSGTSFATPHVAGTAALLIERGVNEGLSHDHLSIKSVLMNSASKHVQAPDGAGGWEAWTESAAGQAALQGVSTTPLDDAMGIGQLNALAAVRQYQPGNRSDVGLQGTAIGAGQTQSYDLFVGRGELKPGSLVTATLVWDRPVALNTGGTPTNNGDYTGTVLPDLDLRLARRNPDGTTTAVASSTSTLDNVEHIYFNVRQEGHYQLQVSNLATRTVEDYGLTFTAGTSDGPAFSVDGGLFNANRTVAANPAEGRMAPFNNAPYPNDVNALGTAGPANFATEGEIFASSLDGSNMQRLSGALGTVSRVGAHNAPPAAMAVLDPNERGVMGLRPNDNVVGLSWGTDGTLDPKTLRPDSSVLLFSVDPDSIGIGGTDVNYQAVVSPPLVGPDPRPFPLNVPGGAPGEEAAGDIFKSQLFDPFGSFVSEHLNPARPADNRLFVDEERLGLQAPNSRGSLLGSQEDDLDGLEMDSPLFVDPDGDGMHNKPVFFNLDRWSVSLEGNRSPDDIFISFPADTGLDFDLMPDGMFMFDIYADGVRDIQLRVGDAIDALVLSNVDSLLGLDKGKDEALFSLDPMSTSLGFGANPADVYYTDFARPFNPLLDWKLGGSLFAPAALLGLMASDNLNALDIRRVPLPTTVSLLLVGWLVISLRRRRCRAERLAGDQHNQTRL